MTMALALAGLASVLKWMITIVLGGISIAISAKGSNHVAILLRVGQKGEGGGRGV